MPVKLGGLIEDGDRTNAKAWSEEAIDAPAAVRIIDSDADVERIAVNDDGTDLDTQQLSGVANWDRQPDWLKAELAHAGQSCAKNFFGNAALATTLGSGTAFAADRSEFSDLSTIYCGDEGGLGASAFDGSNLNLCAACLLKRGEIEILHTSEGTECGAVDFKLVDGR